MESWKTVLGECGAEGVPGGAAQSNSEVQNMVMILKKTKLLRRNRPRIWGLRVLDGLSTGTRTHWGVRLPFLARLLAPLSLRGISAVPPHLCQLNNMSAVNIPLTLLFKLLIEMLNRPEPNTYFEHAWGVPNMLLQLWRILFYIVRKKLIFYIFS